ncbi:MAG TPA: glycosyltransferase family 4 protein [Candidatus Limnocylindria bacterium]|nr:glycosyltransferase family 4 protein [Candidatus Limnocylindria bacterium]
MSRRRPLRLALLAAPMVPIPPPGYAGTERIVSALLDELVARGHAVTLFGPGDSTAGAEIVPTVERALWPSGITGDVVPWIQLSIERAWSAHERFDLIHSHVDTHGFSFARHCPTPILHTLHGRLDFPGVPDLLDEFRDIPLVAISDSQRRWKPENNWVATIHHGLPLDRAPHSDAPGNYLVFVGRVAPEKGVDDAIELARMTGMPLRMAAKVHEPEEQQLYAEVVEPAIAEGLVKFQGELSPTERDSLMAGALATVMLGAWPEPFGLVAIESMATGTPVIARRAGALTETIEHGETGFLVDDLTEARLAVALVADLDRRRIRERAVERFSVARMVDEYEDVYYRLVDRHGGRRTAHPVLEAGALAARDSPIAAGWPAVPATGGQPSPAGRVGDG